MKRRQWTARLPWPNPGLPRSGAASSQQTFQPCSGRLTKAMRLPSVSSAKRTSDAFQRLRAQRTTICEARATWQRISRLQKNARCSSGLHNFVSNNASHWMVGSAFLQRPPRSGSMPPQREGTYLRRRWRRSGRRAKAGRSVLRPRGSAHCGRPMGAPCMPCWAVKTVPASPATLALWSSQMTPWRSCRLLRAEWERPANLAER